MAPDATVLVALRRPSRFLHHSFDGGGLLARCTDAVDTSAALRPDHMARAGWSGAAAFFRIT
eukprot:444964-Prymnesium_polylepis.1